MDNFYVYMYLRSNKSKHGDVGSPYYVGKGRGSRAYDTVSRCGCKVPTDKSRIFFVATNLSEKDAFQIEMLLIHLHGRADKGTGCLRNLTDGGEGVSGHSHSQEVRQRLSKSLTAHFQIPANRQRMSTQVKNYFQDPEARKNHVHNRVKLYASGEVQKKIGESNSRYFSDEEARIRQSEIIKTSIKAQISLEAIHQKLKGTVLITKDGKDQRISKSDLEQRLSQGWKRGTSVQGSQIFVNKNGRNKRILKIQLEEYLRLGWNKGSIQNWTPEIRIRQSKIVKSIRGEVSCSY